MMYHVYTCTTYTIKPSFRVHACPYVHENVQLGFVNGCNQFSSLLILSANNFTCILFIFVCFGYRFCHIFTASMLSDRSWLNERIMTSHVLPLYLPVRNVHEILHVMPTLPDHTIQNRETPFCQYNYATLMQLYKEGTRFKPIMPYRGTYPYI